MKACTVKTSFMSGNIIYAPGQLVELEDERAEELEYADLIEIAKEHKNENLTPGFLADGHEDGWLKFKVDPDFVHEPEVEPEAPKEKPKTKRGGTK